MRNSALVTWIWVLNSLGIQVLGSLDATLRKGQNPQSCLDMLHLICSMAVVCRE